MATTRNIFVLFLVFLFLFCSFVAESYAETYTAASASYAEVSAKVSAASAGDTVIVPSGSATWTKSLGITKGIILKAGTEGGGAGATTITAGTLTSPSGTSSELEAQNYLIAYTPDNTNITNNTPCRITGFTLDCASKSAGIIVKNGNASAKIITKIRIDHNTISNARGNIGGGRGITVYGFVYGVADNNTVDNCGESFDVKGYAPASWNNLTVSRGSANAFYFEDNTVTNLPNQAMDQDNGSLAVLRYNTFTTVADLIPWIVVHGNTGSGGDYSAMGVEMYGNIITDPTNNHNIQPIAIRGGIATVFYNKVLATAASSDLGIREDCDDVSNATNNGSAGPSGQPQHVSDTYLWNNRRGTTLYATNGYIAGRLDNCCPPTQTGCTPACSVNNNGYVIAENANYWMQKTASFNGTTGVGCGELENRPDTCTQGVAYWATDQPCDTVDSANIGVNPTTPISGKLYRCLANGTWETSATAYTPYTYPHPLRISSNPPKSPDLFFVTTTTTVP